MCERSDAMRQVRLAAHTLSEACLAKLNLTPNIWPLTEMYDAYLEDEIPASFRALLDKLSND